MHRVGVRGSSHRLFLAAAIIVIIVTVRSLIIICPPNRVAVISGRSRQLSDGRRVGYRAIRGGRTLRVPLLERVAWMDLNSIPIEVSVHNAYSRGGIPLNVQGIANVKVSSNESLLQNSVERFLGVPQGAIAEIAKETLEANLRGVLARCDRRPTPTVTHEPMPTRRCSSRADRCAEGSPGAGPQAGRRRFLQRRWGPRPRRPSGASTAPSPATRTVEV
jgi:hypothetical protein